MPVHVVLLRAGKEIGQPVEGLPGRLPLQQHFLVLLGHPDFEKLAHLGQVVGIPVLNDGRIRDHFHEGPVETLSEVGVRHGLREGRDHVDVPAVPKPLFGRHQPAEKRPALVLVTGSRRHGRIPAVGQGHAGPGPGGHDRDGERIFVKTVFQACPDHLGVLFHRAAEPRPESLDQFVETPVQRVGRREAVLVEVVPVGQSRHVVRTVDHALVVFVEPRVGPGEFLGDGPPGPEAAPGAAQGVPVALPGRIRDLLEERAPLLARFRRLETVFIEPFGAVEHGTDGHFRGQSEHLVPVEGHGRAGQPLHLLRIALQMGPVPRPRAEVLEGAHGAELGHPPARNGHDVGGRPAQDRREILRMGLVPGHLHVFDPDAGMELHELGDERLEGPVLLPRLGRHETHGRPVVPAPAAAEHGRAEQGAAADFQGGAAGQSLRFRRSGHGEWTGRRCGGRCKTRRQGFSPGSARPTISRVRRSSPRRRAGAGSTVPCLRRP